MKYREKNPKFKIFDLKETVQIISSDPAFNKKGIPNSHH